MTRVTVRVVFWMPKSMRELEEMRRGARGYRGGTPDTHTPSLQIAVRSINT